MASEIKLSREDIEALKNRLANKDLGSDEHELIEALIEMAKNHPVPDRPGIMWIFNWNKPPPPPKP
jgi:hypothetical protein